MMLGESVVLASRCPPSSVPVLSCVKAGVLSMYASASYETVVISLTGANCVVLLRSSVQHERV